MKRILLIILVMIITGLLVAFPLAGCNPTTSEGEKSTETDSNTEEEVDIADITEEMEEEIIEAVEDAVVWDFDADPVTISVASFFASDNLEVEQSVVDAFSEAYPNIIVEYSNTSYSDYFTLLSTSIMSGDVPDVLAMNYEQGETYAALGALEDLTPFIEAENYNLDKYFSSTVDMNKHAGIQASLPATFSIVINFINKDLFDVAGISYPDDNWTWDDYTTAARAMTLDTDNDGALDQFGSIAGWWPNYIFQNGGEILNDEGRCGLNTPEAVEGLQIMVDQILAEDRYAPNRTELGDVGEWDRFMQGTIGIMPNGPWAIKPFKDGIKDIFEWDVVPFTGIKKKATFMFGNSYAMSSTSEQKAAAWEFIKFATGEEGSTLRQAGEYEMSPVKEVANRDFIASLGGVPENAQYFLEATSYAVMPTTHPEWASLSDIIEDEVGLALLGTKTVADALADAAEAVDAKLIELGY